MGGLERPEGGWESFFRELWDGLVTEDSISKYELKYRGEFYKLLSCICV